MFGEDNENEIGQLKQFKVAILGNGTAGKSSIVQRVIDDVFGGMYMQTIGLEFSSKSYKIGGTEVNLQIWDIGGQSITSPMIEEYVVGAHCVCLVYDVTSLDTFIDLEEWADIVKKAASKMKKSACPRVMVLANKMDLVAHRVVSPEAHNKFLNNVLSRMFSSVTSSAFISAKTGDGVHQVFTHIAASVAGLPVPEADVKITARVIAADSGVPAKVGPSARTESAQSTGMTASRGGFASSRFEGDSMPSNNSVGTARPLQDLAKELKEEEKSKAKGTKACVIM